MTLDGMRSAVFHLDAACRRHHTTLDQRMTREIELDVGVDEAPRVVLVVPKILAGRSHGRIRRSDDQELHSIPWLELDLVVPKEIRKLAAASSLKAG